MSRHLQTLSHICFNSYCYSLRQQRPNSQNSDHVLSWVRSNNVESANSSALVKYGDFRSTLVWLNKCRGTPAILQGLILNDLQLDFNLRWRRNISLTQSPDVSNEISNSFIAQLPALFRSPQALRHQNSYYSLRSTSRPAFFLESRSHQKIYCPGFLNGKL